MSQRCYVLSLPVASDSQTIHTIGPRTFMDVWRDALERFMFGLTPFRSTQLYVPLITFRYTGASSEDEFRDKVVRCLKEAFLHHQAFFKLLDLHFGEGEICQKGARRIVYRVKAHLYNCSGVLDEFVNYTCLKLTTIEHLELVGKYPRRLSLYCNLYDSSVARNLNKTKAFNRLRRMLNICINSAPRDDFGMQQITEMRLHAVTNRELIKRYMFCSSFENSFAEKGRCLYNQLMS